VRKTKLAETGLGRNSLAALKISDDGRSTAAAGSSSGGNGVAISLWQGRFASFVLDEPYLLTAARYVELNPVRAGVVNAPSSYRWSSAAAHVRGRDDALARVAPLLKLAPPWRGFLARVIREEDIKLMRVHESTGRPLGDEEFLTTLEQNLGRILRRQKPGPKPQAKRTPKRQTMSTKQHSRN
jgi:putative transposase